MAVANADKWTNGTLALDFVGAVNRALHPLTDSDHLNSLAWGHEELEYDLGRKVQCLREAVKSAAGWERFIEEVQAQDQQHCRSWL